MGRSGKSSWKSIDYALYAARLRRSLLEKLAPDGRCQKCRKKPRMLDSLHVDHVHGRNWDPAKMNRWARARRYQREHENGVELRALCIKCSGSHNPVRLRRMREQEQADEYMSPEQAAA